MVVVRNGQEAEEAEEAEEERLVVTRKTRTALLERNDIIK
jgi:hypothetical protein